MANARHRPTNANKARHGRGREEKEEKGSQKKESRVCEGEGGGDARTAQERAPSTSRL